MTQELNELTLRLDRLEQQNRRLKLWGGIACGAFALIGLAGAAAVCDVVTGERLVLHDPSGRTRVTLDAYSSDSPSLLFRARDGRALANFGADEDGAAWVVVYDKKGETKTTYRFSAESKASTHSAPKDESKKDEPSVAGTSTEFTPF